MLLNINTLIFWVHRLLPLLEYTIFAKMASTLPGFPHDTKVSTNFAQQGQVDWVAFGQSTWSMIAAVMQRFASADVQAVTYGAALAIGCQFNLGELGHRRVSEALQHSKGFPSFRKLLWFGFGYKSFVHVLSQTQPGFNCLALCACLVARGCE